MRATNVFTPGKLPEFTYIDSHLTRHASVLADALEAGAAVVSLSGPSKSGKTVFIEKNIGKDRLIQVTGAGIASTEKLWDRVFDLIGTPVAKSSTVGSGFEGSVGGKLEGGVPFITKGEITTSGKWQKSSAEQQEAAVDYLQLLIRELGGTEFVVFIDDFHYIPLGVQQEIANQIKEAIRQDVKFVIASVPYHSDDAIRANTDLRGRTVKLDFDYWGLNELQEIATRGFDELQIISSDAFVQALASEAAGSPQLMQSLCLNACFEADARERFDEPTKIDTSLEMISKICTRTALTADYTSTVEKMREGPKTRGQERKTHALKDGTISDVYPLILRAVALDPPTLTIRYPELVGRIQQLCAAEAPSGSSIIGACSQLASIANDSENQVVVEWDGESDVLDIRDPYLLFFLRWGD